MGEPFMVTVVFGLLWVSIAQIEGKIHTLPDEVRLPDRGMHYGVPVGYTLPDEVRPPGRVYLLKWA